MANPVKAGDAKPWVYAGYVQYDRQVAEEGKIFLFFLATPMDPGLLFCQKRESKQATRANPGKPGDAKLRVFIRSEYDRRTTEMGLISR